jgi:hypothetical protein
MLRRRHTNCAPRAEVWGPSRRRLSKPPCPPRPVRPPSGDSGRPAWPILPLMPAIRTNGWRPRVARGPFKSPGCFAGRSGLCSRPVLAEAWQDALGNQHRGFGRNQAGPPVRVRNPEELRQSGRLVASVGRLKMARPSWHRFNGTSSSSNAPSIVCFDVTARAARTGHRLAIRGSANFPTPRDPRQLSDPGDSRPYRGAASV